MSYFDFCCLGAKGLLGLHVWSYPSVREVWAGSQGRSLEEGTESEAMEELTVRLPRLALLAFIDNPGPQPRAASPMVFCAFHVNRQSRNVPQTLPQADVMRVIL